MGIYDNGTIYIRVECSRRQNGADLPTVGHPHYKVTLISRTNTSQKCEAVPRRARTPHRPLHHSTLGSRVIMKKKNNNELTI